MAPKKKRGRKKEKRSTIKRRFYMSEIAVSVYINLYMTKLSFYSNV